MKPQHHYLDAERPAPHPKQPMKRAEAVLLGLALLGMLAAFLYKF